ncbi:DUF2851 family protein [Algibacter aquimarinus]|uniref:DUF2851 family protein n=2 Tax=Algibacter aquimarinus TaxID=1136748 RepID=A0ABP9H5E4_9FLAO
MLNLKTESGESLSVVSLGEHNLNSGPDFFNSQLLIGNQLWAGNVEIHVKSSDWFLHNHENDKAYDNVILHVVWEHDTEVFRKDNTVIPILQLKSYISESVFNKYKQLFNSKDRWINCENDFASIDGFLLNNWLERLYFERLEEKSNLIEQLLETSKNDWEAVLFKMLSKTFGLKVNGDAFLSLAQSLDFSVVRKTQSTQKTLEALLFGQTGLLNDDIQNSYFLNLKKDYQFLKQKFNLENAQVLQLQFFRLRPNNFPTIRLSQLSNLYHKHQNLFSKLIESKSLNEFYELFKVETSEFWENHYTFQKESKKSKKVLSKSFIDLLLINTIIPVKFSYAIHQGKSINDDILELIAKIKSEKNSIIDSFNNLKPISKSALQSQSLIQLKNHYCDKNKCLQCVVGNTLLGK